jgi:uncharacterized membrane protein required for colicin V production
MNLIAGFNWLDFFFFFLIIVSMIVGFVQGLLRQVIGLAALYIGAILGMQYYGLLSEWVRALTFQPTTNRFLNALCFLVILILVASVINWLAYDAYRSTRLQILPLIDQLGGVILALVTMLILIALLLPVVAFATVETWPWGEPARVFIDTGLKSSRLITIFNDFKPLLLTTLLPWLPAGLPALFTLQPGR